MGGWPPPFFGQLPISCRTKGLNVLIPLPLNWSKFLILNLNPNPLNRVTQKTRNGILPTICGCSNWFLISVYEVTSPINSGSRHCLTKCALEKKLLTEPKLLILVSFFSWEVTSNNDTSYCIHILREVCRSAFSGPPCISLSYTLMLIPNSKPNP